MSTQAHLDAGIRAQREGRLADAARHFQKAVAETPRDARAWTCLGSVLQMAGRGADAGVCYERALGADPAFADASYNLGTLRQGERRLEEALAAYQATAQMQPGHTGALAGMATMMDWQGRDEAALSMLEQQIGQHPSGDLELELIYARLLSRGGSHQPARARLMPLLADGRLTDRQASRVHFTLGRVLDRLGNYQEAFEHFRQGNLLKHANFDRDAFTDFVDELIDTFAPGTMERLVASPVDDGRPVFIVGLPRSGTTLVEQILAAHPQVYAGGENTAFPRVAAGLASGAHGGSYPGCVPANDVQELEAAARAYLGPLPESHARVTDKLPGNFLYLATIAVVLPRARIVHCVRDPVETALSCYMQNFGANSLPFTYDLTDLASYINDYRRLMAHWATLPSIRLHAVRYEALVADQEPATRALLAALGLPWDPACLAFHAVDRPALTASNAQVRKPLYRDALGRTAHYRDYLKPLIEMLGHG